MNLSAIATSWTVEHFDSTGKRNIKAGTLLRLLHQEAGYLMGSLVQQSHAAYGLRDPVMFRHVPPEQRKRPPSSSASLWVVESDKSATSGMISWSSNVRFNLWGTNVYLAFAQRGPSTSDTHTERMQEVYPTLTPHQKSPATLFQLHPFNRKEAGSIMLFGSYVSIQHVRTKCWLKSIPLADSSSRYLPVDCSPKVASSDVFRILPVSQSHLALIDYLQVRRPDLEGCVASMRNQVPLAKIPLVDGTLVDLIQWVTDPPPPSSDPFAEGGIPVRSRQLLLATPAFLDLLVALITVPFQRGHNSFSVLQELPRFNYQCQLVYCLLGKLLFKSKKKALYMYPSLSLLEQHVGRGMGLWRCLVQMFADNEIMCDQFVHEPQVRYFISEMTRASLRSHEFLDFLRVVCVVAERPIKKNQNIVFRLLVEEDSGYLLRTKLHREADDGLIGATVILMSVDGGRSYQPLEELLWSSDHSLGLFLASMLELFAALCVGRNADVATRVQHMVSLEEAIAGMTHKDLPYAIRKAYSNILLHTHLHRHPREVAVIRTVYSLGEEIGRDIENENEGGDADQSSEEKMRKKGKEKFSGGEFRWSVVADHVMDLLGSIRYPAAIKTPFFEAILDLTFHMFRFGLIAEKESLALMDLLSTLLWEGLREDDKFVEIIFGALGGGGRTSSQRLIAVKLKVCEIITEGFRRNLCRRLERVAIKCLRCKDIGKVKEDQIAAERRNMHSGMLRNDVLEVALMAQLRHGDHKLAAVAMGLAVSSRSRQIAPFEHVVNSMEILREEEEVSLHTALTRDLLPELDRVMAMPLANPFVQQMRQLLKRLVEMCVTKERRKAVPNRDAQHLLAALGVHILLLQFVDDRISELNRRGVDSAGKSCTVSLSLCLVFLSYC